MRYRINTPQVITETIDGEAIMINLGTGNYYSLAGSGAEVCGWLEQGAEVDAVVEALAQGYDGPNELIADTVQDLIRELEREELIVPIEGDSLAAFQPPGQSSLSTRKNARPSSSHVCAPSTKQKSKHGWATPRSVCSSMSFINSQLYDVSAKIGRT